MRLVIVRDVKERGRRGRNLQAHPTQRRNTTSVARPPPRRSLRSRSIGAISPMLGQSLATGTGGGGGDSHACTAIGIVGLTLIHAGHELSLPSSSKSCAPPRPVLLLAGFFSSS